MKRTVFTYNPMLTRMSKATKAQWKGGIVEDGKRTAIVSCPGCSQVASLSAHTIADNGDVDPSLVCPFDCGFHEYVTLGGWTP